MQSQMGYGDGDGAGGPAWTPGPAVDTGFHGGIPGTALWSPIISDLNRRPENVVLGKAGPGSIKYTQGPAPSPHYHWYDKLKIPVQDPNAENKKSNAFPGEAKLTERGIMRT
jgi:hypothetical protein